jgi:hypothetical protein
MMLLLEKCVVGQSALVALAAHGHVDDALREPLPRGPGLTVAFEFGPALQEARASGASWTTNKPLGI